MCIRDRQEEAQSVHAELLRQHIGVHHVALGLGPVSYTHLDVYKRQEVYTLRSTGFQAQGFADGGAFWSALESARELSLIHI